METRQLGRRWKILMVSLILALWGKMALSAVFLPFQVFVPSTSHEGEATPEAPAASSSAPSVPRLLALMEKERRALVDREAAVAAREEQLRRLKGEIEDRLKELGGLQQRVLGFLEEEKRLQDEQHRHLVMTLEAMPADRAGQVLEKMEEAQAVQLLRRLRGKEAGAILGLLSPDKAARLSQHLMK